MAALRTLPLMVLLGLTLAGNPMSARAELDASLPTGSPAPSASRPSLFAATPLDDAVLDGQRGGFAAPGGLQMSFGIERAVFVNGVLESTTHLRLDDLGQVVASLPRGATLAVVQNGGGNSFATSLPAGTLGTVVQNSLNDQVLQVVSTIDISVNSAELLRSMRLDMSLQDALTRSTTAR